MKKNGFTLVEAMVVITISSMLAFNLLSNFLRSRINMSEVVRIIVSDIRRAQADALSSRQYNNIYRCGFGLHMLTSSQASANEPFGSTYYIFTNKSAPPNCGNYSFQPSDADIITNRILDSRIEICGPPTGSDNCGRSGNFPRFADIFFETPKAIISINNRACPIGNADQSFSQIMVRKKGATCPSSDCAYVCVHARGTIEASSVPCTGAIC